MQSIYDRRQRTEIEMARREQEIKQLQGRPSLHMLPGVPDHLLDPSILVYMLVDIAPCQEDLGFLFAESFHHLSRRIESVLMVTMLRVTALPRCMSPS